MTWIVPQSGKFDPGGARLADGHYSRRTVGSPQFMPLGQTLVLVTEARDAVFGWWRVRDPGDLNEATRRRSDLLKRRASL